MRKDEYGGMSKQAGTNKSMGRARPVNPKVSVPGTSSDMGYPTADFSKAGANVVRGQSGTYMAGSGKKGKY